MLATISLYVGKIIGGRKNAQRFRSLRLELHRAYRRANGHGRSREQLLRLFEARNPLVAALPR
jgi:hypothetical protein